MNIIVTGGAGFIGSHLCEKLMALGHRVINIDNFHEFYSLEIKVKNVLESTNKIELFESFKKMFKEFYLEMDREKILNYLSYVTEGKKYKFYYSDIRDSEEMNKIFSQEKPDFIINLAGLAGVRPSLLNPLLYEDVNVKGTTNLLEMCRKYDVKKFIQASSSSVYGNNKKIPFSENDVVDFSISPYAATKKSCEVMGHVYYALYKIDMFQLRFFTVYGERQRPDLAIHKFVKSISEEKEILMYGDGNTFRDYTYIDDIIQGIIKTINYLNTNENVYEILNLGSNNPISLKNMIAVIEKAMGKKAKIKHLPMQAGDVDKTYADIGKAQKLIGYCPQTKFEKGIENFINWYNR